MSVLNHAMAEHPSVVPGYQLRWDAEYCDECGRLHGTRRGGDGGVVRWDCPYCDTVTIEAAR